MKKAVGISCFHGWYDNRLKPLISVFQNRGYIVNCYLSDFDHIKKEYVNINTSDICKYIHVPAYKSNISINRIISNLAFGHKINNIRKQKSQI